MPVDRDTPVIIARARSLRRVNGMPDTLTLRLEARVPPGIQGGVVIVEQRLTRGDLAKMLAAFEASAPAKVRLALSRAAAGGQQAQAERSAG